MSKTRWAVAAQSRHSAFDWELATATCRYLEQLGHSASIVHDGDHSGLTADVLLLLINLGHYPAYCEKLRRGGSRRPKSILWQMDPLPSPAWPDEALDAGLNAARWKGRFRLHQSSAMPRWKKFFASDNGPANTAQRRGFARHAASSTTGTMASTGCKSGA